MVSVSTDVVREAIRLGVIEPADADRFLRDPAPPRPLPLVPRIPPSPERLRLVRPPTAAASAPASGSHGALLKAGVLSPAAAAARPPAAATAPDPTTTGEP
jgi:hypothetical protein